MPPSSASLQLRAMAFSDREILELAAKSNDTRTRLLLLILRQLRDVEHAIAFKGNVAAEEYDLRHLHCTIEDILDATE